MSVSCVSRFWGMHYKLQACVVRKVVKLIMNKLTSFHIVVAEMN